MADYLTLSQTAQSSEAWEDDLQVERSVNGVAKGRSFFTAKKKRFVVRHVVTAAQKASVQSFYDSYRTDIIVFVWAADNVTYNCLFERPPTFEYLGAGYWDAEVRLMQK